MQRLFRASVGEKPEKGKETEYGHTGLREYVAYERIIVYLASHRQLSRKTKRTRLTVPSLSHEIRSSEITIPSFFYERYDERHKNVSCSCSVVSVQFFVVSVRASTSDLYAYDDRDRPHSAQTNGAVIKIANSRAIRRI